jgi:thioredoxin reductase (NADPH)
MVEVAVIGAGPCGLSVGVAAREAGLSCVHFDKGCLTSTIERYPTLMTFFSTAEKVELGGLPFITPTDKPTRLDALKYYRRVASHFELGVRQYEEVVGVSGSAGAFTLRVRRSDGEEYDVEAANVVVATGYFDNPNLLGVPGEELPKVFHYYREAHPFWNQDCIVIGAGNSAVDVALDLYRTGARVTLVHFLDTLDAGVKPWVLPDITNRLKAGDIAARWRTHVLEIKPRSVVLKPEGGPSEEVANDWVFAMTGYRPDTHLLDALGVTIDERTGIPTHDRDTMRTNVPGVYLAGVIAAGRDANKIFIENGREHGGRIVRGVSRD